MKTNTHTTTKIKKSSLSQIHEEKESSSSLSHIDEEKEAKERKDTTTKSTNSNEEKEVKERKDTTTKSTKKSFLELIEEANSNVICTSSNPQTLTFKSLLRRTLRIPMFQRRYAWNTPNWNQTFLDVCRLADRIKSSHFFGRMTCVVSTSPSALVVVDGQQRSTTLSLLLAACRDIAEKNRNLDQVNQINRLLLFGTKLKRVDFATMSAEEICVKCCRLVPTICDRDPYLRAILPRSFASRVRYEGLTGEEDMNRLSRAKRFFTERLQSTKRTSTSKLQDISNAVLSKIQWLLFPIDIGGREDGTQHLGVIFQRLAKREATWTRPPSRSLYAEMLSVDFVRNLLLAGFAHDESLALKMYKSHWLVIEREANAVGKGSGERVLESMIRAYLDANEEKSKKTSHEKTTSVYHSQIEQMIGGSLYSRFRLYVSQQPDLDAEELLIKIKSFAMDVFFKKVVSRSD